MKFLSIFSERSLPVTRTFLFLNIALLPCFIFAQSGIGEWRVHLPYNDGQQVVSADKRVYCGSNSGLFYYDREFNTVNIFTKSDGLSDLEISAIDYSPGMQSLVIGYENTNLDILDGDGIYNIPDIKRKQITANKTIHNIMIVDELAYLSCGFGIVVLNMERKEIKDTYLIGENGSYMNVYDMATDGINLYAATESGIMTALLEGSNLVDFSSWSQIDDIPGAGGKISSVCWYNGKLYAAYRDEAGGEDVLYYRDGNVWQIFPVAESGVINHVGEASGYLVVVTRYISNVYTSDHELAHSLYTPWPAHSIIDSDGTQWVADRTRGMYRRLPGRDPEILSPDGPMSRDVVSIEIQDDVVQTVAGNVDPGWNNLFNHAELNNFSENIWEGSVNADYRDLLDLAIDPSDNTHVFAVSWGYGLLEYRGTEIEEVYTSSNSSLQTLPLGETYYRLGGCTFDDQHNLWVTNSGVEEPVSVRKPDGTWKSYRLDGKLNVDILGRILNLSNDNKWIICPYGHGLFAFDINGTIDDISDDNYEKFNVLDVNGKLISGDVYSFAEDKNNNIWVGTGKGVVVYYSPSRVFGDDLFYGQQIIVPRNDGTGLADILLGTEKVTAIAVDGANRKWLGTDKSGVYLVSDDGLDEIHHFTEENSALLSNCITDIDINGKDGIVYIGTDKGLISYKSTAIEGRENFAGVYAYPNPVRHDYAGDIVITGLVGNVNVKITDITGQIVYETEALGGQAIWDGRSFSGKRVSTGVYVVFISDDDGTMTHITKILVVN